MTVTSLLPSAPVVERTGVPDVIAEYGAVTSFACCRGTLPDSKIVTLFLSLLALYQGHINRSCQKLNYQSSESPTE